jgi:SAM-dependent methyltransferase
MKDLTITVAPENIEQGRAWDGDEGEYWARHADRFDASMSRYQDRLMAAAAVGTSDRVLDVGCGTGQTTRDAARAAPDGEALGIDLSSQMLAVARRRAAEEGLANVAFEHGDAQVFPFPDQHFDVVLSRTGCMFFGDAPAAWRNIARATRPGGRLALLVWQPAAENLWFRTIVEALFAGRPVPTPPPEAPSPLSMADPARVRRLLTAAGFTEPVLTGLRASMWFGADAEDAQAFIVGLAGWMLEGLDDARRAGALADLLRRLREHETGTGVELDSATWLVTATRQAEARSAS